MDYSTGGEQFPDKDLPNESTRTGDEATTAVEGVQDVHGSPRLRAAVT